MTVESVLIVDGWCGPNFMSTPDRVQAMSHDGWQVHRAGEMQQVRNLNRCRVCLDRLPWHSAPFASAFAVVLTLCLWCPFPLAKRKPRLAGLSPSPSQALACLLNYAKCLFLLAEAVRFELTDGRPSPVFKTGAFNRSATLPNSNYNCFQDRCIKPLCQTSKCQTVSRLAEAVRFELTEGSHPRRFSRPLH